MGSVTTSELYDRPEVGAKCPVIFTYFWWGIIGVPSQAVGELMGKFGGASVERKSLPQAVAMFCE